MIGAGIRMRLGSSAIAIIIARSCWASERPDETRTGLIVARAQTFVIYIQCRPGCNVLSPSATFLRSHAFRSAQLPRHSPTLRFPNHCGAEASDASCGRHAPLFNASQSSHLLTVVEASGARSCVLTHPRRDRAAGMPAHAAQRAQDIHPEGAGQPSALANRGALTHPHASERRVVQPLTGVTQHPQSLQPRERSLSSQREHLPPFRQLLHSDFQTSPAGHAHPPYSPRASAGSSAEGPSPRPSPHVGPSPTRTGSGLDVLLGERPLARSAAIAFPPAWELANPGPSTSGPVSTPMQPDGRRWSTSRPDYRGWDAAAGLVTVDSTRQPSGPGGAIRPHGTGMLHRSASVGHAPMGSAPAPTLGEAFATMSPTGTQTLRRLTGEQIVPGEGPCYVYEDGTYCRTVVEGEPVNPHWGLTKAGRPRKRLAEACLTCRLKKIKCEPDRPKCVQCEKLGRVCRFKTAYVRHLATPEFSRWPCQVWRGRAVVVRAAWPVSERSWGPIPSFIREHR